MTERHQTPRKPHRAGYLFLFSQVAVLVLIVAAAKWGASRTVMTGSPTLPTLNNEPLKVRPNFDEPSVVSDAQLQHVLHVMRLPADRTKIKINHVDHALRLWGYSSDFTSEYLSGREMTALLTDDAAYRKSWGKQARPLVYQSRNGQRIRTQQGAASASHVDHTLATFGEIGLPLYFPVSTRQGRTDLRTLVQHSLQRFSLNQREYEWTALVLALYAPNTSAWQTYEGQTIEFDDLAVRIMRQEYGQGVCYGEHRLFTLVMMRRIDIDTQRLFSDSVRDQIDNYLNQATARLVASQSVEGYWDRSWPGFAIYEETPLWPRGARLLATSHALEWWAMAPKQYLPPRETIVRAAQWMVSEIEQLDPVAINKNYTFLTHSARSLALWRGGFPEELYRSESHIDESNVAHHSTRGTQ